MYEDFFNKKSFRAYNATLMKTSIACKCYFLGLNSFDGDNDLKDFRSMSFVKGLYKLLLEILSNWRKNGG